MEKKGADTCADERRGPKFLEAFSHSHFSVDQFSDVDSLPVLLVTYGFPGKKKATPYPK
jgi:hypothetical protein